MIYVLTAPRREHVNYCVAFDDFIVKTGITAQPFFRLQDYLQDAARRERSVTRFEITARTSKATAIRIEKHICLLWHKFVLAGRREWFQMPTLAGCDDLFLTMEAEWSRHTGLPSEEDAGMRAFAKELAKHPRISATRASALAGMVSA